MPRPGRLLVAAASITVMLASGMMRAASASSGPTISKAGISDGDPTSPSRPGRPGNAAVSQSVFHTILHVGDHGSFGRVVFVLPPGVAAGALPDQLRDGDRLTLDLPGAGTIRTVAPGSDVTRNLRSASLARDKAVLTLARGSTTRLWRDGGTLVLDIFGPGAKPPGRGDGGLASNPAPAAPLQAPAKLVPTRTSPGRGAAPSATPRLRQTAAPTPGTAAPAPAKRATAHAPGPPVSSPPVTSQAGLPPPGTRPPATPAPPAAIATPSQAAEHTSPAASRLTAPGGVAPDNQAARPAEPEDDDPASSPPEPGAAEIGAALRAIRLPGPEPSILLPFDGTTGAASFPLGAVGGSVLGHVVFDSSKAIDLAAMKGDAVFGSASITLLPASTQLTMVVPPGGWLGLRRAKEGWVVTLRHGRGPAQGAPTRLKDGVVSMVMPGALGAVVLIDPATGGKLLVGTMRDHGPAILVPHRSPELAILPTWEGVLVAAIGDRVSLLPGKAGFRLQNSAGPRLAMVMPDVSQAALEAAGALTRHFAIPPMQEPALLRRMDADIAAAAAAPRQARFAPRVRIAQDMLGLGMGREAGTVLDAARQDDPARQSEPDAIALQGMARFLADGAAPGTPGTPELGLANPALGDADEVAFWRSIAQPQNMAIAERAAVLAASWPLMNAYPAALRRDLVPAVAAILIAGNQHGAAIALLDAAGEDGGPGAAVPMARARLMLTDGQAAAALALLDRVANSSDRRNAAAARRLAIEQRLRTGALTPSRAAEALLSHIDGWREPTFESAQRLRAAELLVQAGDYRRGLAEMRTVAAMFPETQDPVHAAEQRAVQALLQAGAGASLSPLDLVALVGENADLLGEHAAATMLTPLLVDRLLALDLPGRAEGLVGKLLDSTTDAMPRAALGARLAALRLDQRDARGALAALDATETPGSTPASTPDLTSELADRRSVQRAGALVLLGQDDAARAILASHGSADALTMMAGLAEKSHDWNGAEAALLRLTRLLIPPSGVLTDAQQDLVLRLAGAASQNGDAAMLRRLQDGDATRLAMGPRTALFQMLVTQPVRGVDDLPRSGQEAEAARRLPAALARYDAR